MTKARNVALGTLLVALCATGCTAVAIGPNFRTNLAGAINAAQPQLAECYSQALARNPTTAGQMSITFEVQPNTGLFTATNVGPTQIKDVALQTCVCKVIGGLHVPSAPSVKVAVDYPLSFKPAK
jgi:hypothetical protein